MLRARYGIFGVALLGLIWLAAGCTSTEKKGLTESKKGVPDWVVHPVKEGYYSAVGVSGPTMYRKDAIDGATEDARKQLAMVLQAKVKVVRYEESQGGTGSRGSTDILEVSQSVSDVVLQKSEIYEVWFDRDGLHGQPGYTYAVARVRIKDCQDVLGGN
ncbi:MAG: LPP20 family lipoprotein [Planctomycetes bacterium]|nr:LPP20 family lipoprotein [Planctomycetota bacterium]